MIEMKISDLKLGMSRANIEATITDKSDIREVTTRNGRVKLANATIEDETGSITLVLWGDDAEKVSRGNRIKVENGFIKEWNNRLQLTTGKFGKLTILNSE